MITKSAHDTTANRKDLVYTNSARNAWKLILNSVKREHGHTHVLLPSYIGFTEREGSGVFDPIESTSSEFSFYKINDNLSADINSIERAIKNNKINVLLVIHYFGFCRNDLNVIRQICDANQIILVEDCAHAFHIGSHREALGIVGDFSFYSVHKYLPVSSGGILKKITKKIRLENIPNRDKMSIDPAIQLLSAEYEIIRKQRRSNYKTYMRLLSGIKGIEAIYELNEDDIPQTFPIRVKNQQRERLYFYLMNKNMPTTALYYRLIDNIVPEEYPTSHQISQEILNLPVHQDISKIDIQNLVKEISDFMSDTA